MRPLTVFVGLLGGALAAMLLGPMMYLDVPRTYIADWSLAPRAAGLLSTVGAGAVWVATGVAGGASWPERQAKGGALAGFVAALVTLLMVMPGLGVAAHGDLITMVEAVRVSDIDLRRAVVRSVVLPPWDQTLGAAATLATGLLLGWIGGVIHDLWRGQPTRAAPTLRPSPVAWVGLGSMSVMTPALLAGIVSTESLVFGDLGATPTWLGQAQLTAPLGLGFAIAGVCLGLIARDAVLVARSGARARAAIWLVGAAVLVALPLAAVPIYWRILILPGGLVGMLSTGLFAIGGLIAGAASTDDLETQPRVFQDVVGEGVLAGALVAAQTSIHGFSATMAIGLLSNPFRSMLIDGVTQSSNASLAEAVQYTFVSHLALVAVGSAAAAAYLTIGLPVWLVARFLQR